MTIATPYQQFSSEDGSIQGAIDGINTIFTISANLTASKVFLNGVLMTNGIDCTAGNGSIVFSTSQTPQPGHIITVYGSLNQ